MAQSVLRIAKLPDAALDAAGAFHTHVAGELRKATEALPEGGDMVVIFPPASHDHTAWREAAVQDMARAAAPRHRFNAIVGEREDDIDAVLAYLADAAGVTGQVFTLDEINGQDGNPAKSD